MKNKFIQANSIRLHYLEYEGNNPTIILMHGLTANAHAFDGLIAAGLSPAFNVISVDLRGRGLSEQPDEGYSINEHAKDIIGLMDNIKIDRAIIGGHSFGALVTLFIAVHWPDRVDKMILLDVAANMHPNAKAMLGPALSRLGRRYDSFDAYLEKVKQAPYLNFWDASMLSYYEADVKRNEDGSVMCIPGPAQIQQAVAAAFSEPWTDYIKKVNQPALLINGPGIYTMDAPLIPEQNALEMANMMKDCIYAKVTGNHQTMLYGEGAKDIVSIIKQFLN
jgi:pimeloyl-ACP methyl ester carboxylesterase